MTDNVESLILEQIRRIHLRMDRKDIEDLETKMRLTSLDDHLGGVMMSVAGINNRLDRLDERVGRIERRLDLTESK